jgi:Cu2+-exporting ATPase
MSAAASKVRAGLATCIHCGTGFRPTAQLADFCCRGCQFVHSLIARNGLGQFYDLQEGGVQPVKSLVFQKRDYLWLDELALHAETGAAVQPALALDLQGVSCIGCVWLIEKLFTRRPGALAIAVDPNLGRIELRWQRGAFDVTDFARELQSFGYLVGPPSPEPRAPSRALIVRVGICAALAMNAMLFTLPGYLGMEHTFQFTQLFERITVAVGTLSVLIGGSYFFTRTWHSLRNRVLHIDLPISLGLVAAYGASVFAWIKGAHGFVYFDFVSIFVFLMLVGRWLQQKAVERNRGQLLAAQAGPAPVALVGSDERKPVSEIASGVAYIVAPGQPIPVRSRLLSGGATLGLEWINGESDAVTARAGRVVPSGAIHYGQEPIELDALEPWSDSMLARLLRAAPVAAQRNRAVERFIRGYIFAVLGIALIGFGAWFAATGDLLAALPVLVSVLVVSCPCASGVALPLADDLAVSALRRRGVFIREGTLWSRLERVRKILFDKTGTLTLETTALLNPDSLAALPAPERSILLAMVWDSLHPASCALRENLVAAGVSPVQTPPVSESVGFGLEVKHAGVHYRLGRAGWAANADGDCVFGRDGTLLAAFRFGEEVRAGAVEEVAALRARGCGVFILSGDRFAKVESMARQLHLPEGCCRAEMTPDEKAAWVRQLDDRDTLFIGDGANDSLAFNAAHCTGTPAIDRGLLEHKADFYFLGRGLDGVRRLLDAAAARRRTIRRVLTFTIGYNIFAIALSLAGHMNPLAAAILMPASSVMSLAIVFASHRR